MRASFFVGFALVLTACGGSVSEDDGQPVDVSKHVRTSDRNASLTYGQVFAQQAEWKVSRAPQFLTIPVRQKCDFPEPSTEAKIYVVASGASDRDVPIVIATEKSVQSSRGALDLIKHQRAKQKLTTRQRNLIKERLREDAGHQFPKSKRSDIAITDTSAPIYLFILAGKHKAYTIDTAAGVDIENVVIADGATSAVHTRIDPARINLVSAADCYISRLMWEPKPEKRSKRALTAKEVVARRAKRKTDIQFAKEPLEFLKRRKQTFTFIGTKRGFVSANVLIGPRPAQPFNQAPVEQLIVPEGAQIVWGGVDRALKKFGIDV